MTLGGRPIVGTAWLLVAVLVLCGPVLGWPPVLRGSAVVGIPLLITWLSTKPWAWTAGDWQRVASFEPSRSHITTGAVLAGLLLTWIVITLFQGGHINGVDFTIYFDRPLYQTLQGRALYVETTDNIRFQHVTHLGVHAYWLLVPLSLLYAIWASPYWLLVLSVGAVTIGSVYVLRIGRYAGLGGILSIAAAAAVLLNDNTARALRYGFHPEVLYLWFVPWVIDTGLHNRRWWFLTAVVATVLVKEDAILPLIAAVAALAILSGRAMSTRERAFYLVMPLALALANLAMFYTYVVPALWPHDGVAYAEFWSNYGPTPVAALASIARQPWSVSHDLVTSGFLTRVLPPFLFLPVIGWRWSIGTLPLVIVFAASANDQVRAFGIYYAIYLVPFYALAAADGARVIASRARWPTKARSFAAALVIVAALVIGPGYALRPWRAEIAAMPSAIDLLRPEPIVLVQSGLYPHAGYETRVRLLTPEALADPRNSGAVLLLARDLQAYPFANSELRALLRRPITRQMPGGLIAVRNGATAAVQATAE